MTNHVIPELDFELLSPHPQPSLPAAELLRFLGKLINLCDILVGSFIMLVKRYAGYCCAYTQRGYYVACVLPEFSKSQLCLG